MVPFLRARQTMTQDLPKEVVEAPTADWVDPSTMMADPYPTYDRLRELGPVVYVPVYRRYLITRHEAVRQAEQFPDLFSSYSETNLTMMHALGGRPMLRKDNPEHASERDVINQTLRPRAINESWTAIFERNADAWINHLLDVGPEKADLNKDFAGPLASNNLIDLLGFPAEVDVMKMWEWSTNFIAGIGNLLDDPEIWERCNQSQREVDEILDLLIPWIKEHPDFSILSHLANSDLPESVVRSNAKLTISGGMNEPQHMVTNMTWALLTHPDQREKLRTQETTWSAAFDETTRWQSPIGMVPRETTREVDWFGCRIPARANVGLLLASANRDVDVFPGAEKFDLSRNARGHLGFGAGVHLCAGKLVASRAIGEIAVPRLLERIPGLRIDENRSMHWNGWVFRGMTNLPVTW